MKLNCSPLCPSHFGWATTVLARQSLNQPYKKSANGNLQDLVLVRWSPMHHSTVKSLATGDTWTHSPRADLKRFLPCIIHHSVIMKAKQKRLWNKDTPPTQRESETHKHILKQYYCDFDPDCHYAALLSAYLYCLTVTTQNHLSADGLHTQSHLLVYSCMHLISTHTHTNACRHTFKLKVILIHKEE